MPATATPWQDPGGMLGWMAGEARQWASRHQAYGGYPARSPGFGPDGPPPQRRFWKNSGRPRSHGKASQDLIERTVRQRSEFCIRTVLDRVGDKDACRICPERSRLRRRRLDELVRCDHHAGDPAGLKVDDVVHTARRAGSSVGEALDHDVALHADLVAEVGGSHLRESGLAEGRDTQPLRGK